MDLLRATAPRVLLVEDEPTIAITLGDDLADHGCRVTVVGDGSAAIGLLAGCSFDAVITDLRLPGASGAEVLAAVRRSCPRAPVLVVSAHQGGLADELGTSGAWACLAKPFANERVLDWLRAAVA